MKKITLSVILAGFLLVFAANGAHAQPTKETLLTAWEAAQKNNPQTIIFEKIEENRYKFKTDILPFDGEVEVINITINDRRLNKEVGGETDKSYSNYGYNIVGYVNAELVGIEKENLWGGKYQYSYPIWSENNTLYYDEESAKWLTQKEYNEMMTKKYASETQIPIEGFWGFLYNFCGYVDIVFITVLVFLIILSLKAYLDQKRAIAANIALAKEHSGLLREILGALKNKK